MSAKMFVSFSLAIIFIIRLFSASTFPVPTASLVRPCVQNALRKTGEASPAGLNPRESGPEVVQGLGGVTTSQTLLGPILVLSQPNYWKCCWPSGIPNAARLLLLWPSLEEKRAWKWVNEHQTNFSLAASFWGICLLSAFILRRLKLASVSIFHSQRPQTLRQVNQSQFIDGETSFASSNASSVLSM